VALKELWNAGAGLDQRRHGKRRRRLWLRFLVSSFICANSPAGLAITRQCFVGAGQPQPPSSSTKTVNDLHTKRLGTLPTATGGIARLAYAVARQAGIEVEPLLRKAGLTDRQIEDRSARIAVHRQIQFLNLAAKSLKDEFLGFHLAVSADLRELGLLFYVPASSETLGDALRRAARYSSIVNEGLFLQYLEGDDVRMAFDYVGVARHSDRHQIEFLMTVLIRLCQHLTGLRVIPTRARITHRRGDQDGSALGAYLGSNISFGARADELTLPGCCMDMMVVSADPYLNDLLVANCERALAHRRTNRGSFRTAVENAIVPLLPHGRVRASVIATRLGLSQRTASRWLALEGVTFSEVLECLRIDLAREYLSDPGVSISRIAWLLGYQEISAFTHAFRRWTGKTPRQARNLLSPP
jgi:AraC-like DNA-binding protein